MNTAEPRQPRQDGCCHRDGPSEEVGSEEGPGVTVLLPRGSRVLVSSPGASLMVNDNWVTYEEAPKGTFLSWSRLCSLLPWEDTARKALTRGRASDKLLLSVDYRLWLWYSSMDGPRQVGREGSALVHGQNQ